MVDNQIIEEIALDGKGSDEEEDESEEEDEDEMELDFLEETEEL